MMGRGGLFRGLDYLSGLSSFGYIIRMTFLPFKGNRDQGEKGVEKGPDV